jgi:hypothetical protein
LINGLNCVTDPSVEKSNTPNMLGADKFYPLGVFGDFSAM